MRGAVNWIVLSALVWLSGCSSHSAFVRGAADDDELVWAYNDGLRIVDGRNEPVASGPSWDGLSDRVACVDDAHAFALEAESDGTWGQILNWTGTGVFVAGIGVTLFLGMSGAVLALAAGPALLLLGAGVLVGGGVLSVGASSLFWIIGNHLQRSALPEAMDAVNVYNDTFLQEERCVRQQPKK